MSEDILLLQPLRRFAQAVADKLSHLTSGESEDQLRGPFENLMTEVAAALGWKIVCTGETLLPGRLGRPDFAMHLNDLLVGYVELKAPGVGATASRFTGHNREQFRRFSAIPNILYTDGNEWALYRDGKPDRKVVRLSGDIASEGSKAVTEQDAQAVEALLREFLTWQPFIPTDRSGKIDLKAFAEMLAPLCRLLRDDVSDALKDPNSPLVRLAEDWRQLLFPEASDEQFADGYAQTVTFALLLGRSEGADPLTIEEAVANLGAQHSLLSRALQVLTDPKAREEIAPSLALLERVIAVVPPQVFEGPQDPWLYFYEDFLAVYDPELRKNAGAYYTPTQVVHAQVRLIDDLLVNRLNRPLAFAEPDVVSLDPAVGTGTYLLGVIEHALQRVEAEQGPGAVPGKATTLAENLYGFEIMVGPYAVAELRVSRALRDKGATLPAEGTHIFLTDTLESPHTNPPQLPLYLEPIAKEHARALEVKSRVPVIVCLGNPPYDRHEAADPENKARTGGWVRWGDEGSDAAPILNDFTEPARAAGHGQHLKNLYNLYVYFWRWALWKVFEHEAGKGPGVVSFISASSYLDGDGFSGMREHMRRLCDEIWIVDLGGEGRGTRREENVFDIQTPVAIAVAVRTGKAETQKPAKVRYARIRGTREEKLAALEEIRDFRSLKWRDCPDEWQAPFRPAGGGAYFDWPLLTDVMPWQQSGVKAGRTWVIAPDQSTLRRRWQALLQVSGEERRLLFKDSPTGRKVHESARPLLPGNDQKEAILHLEQGAQAPPIVRYAYRSFDRQFAFGDNRLLDRPSPALWRAHSERQVYVTSLFSQPLGEGPALTACALIPDLDHFRGSYGAKAVIPLYRTADASEPNLLPGLLELLGEVYGRALSPEDFLAYLYGILAQPAFTERFYDELETRELRVPITRDLDLFQQVRDLGARLLWLHTYGERFVPEGVPRGRIPPGRAKCIRPVPEDPARYPESFEYNDQTRTLRVGEGEFAPVAPEVYDFEVSGLRVVHSWLKYRMKEGGGRKSSPLDNIRPERWTAQFTTELLELLWVLEATLDTYREQERLLEAVVAGECLRAEELPPVPEPMRRSPKEKPSMDRLSGM